MRAVDSKGEKLPKTSLVEALVVATGAGFTTTSSLLSWLIYGLVTYPGMQERLLQELIDNGIIALVPGAMDAQLSDGLFWSALLGSLAVAFLVTTPVNKWMIGRGRGHAVVHAYH